MEDGDRDPRGNGDTGEDGRGPNRRTILRRAGGVTVVGSMLGLGFLLERELTGRSVSESSGVKTGDGNITYQSRTGIQQRIDDGATGDVVSLSGGTYELSGTIRIQTCGAGGCPLRIEGSSTDRPVLQYPKSDWSSDVRSTYDGIYLEASNLTLRNVVIEGAPRNGIKIVGEDTQNVKLENVEVRRCGKDGVRIQDGVHDLEVRNSHFHHNGYAGDEPGSGDGMALTSSTGTPVRKALVTHCDFLYNSDDGLDLFGAEDVDVVRCRSAHNGYYESGRATGGNGNGFKLGGTAADRTGGGAIVGNIAVSNSNYGFNWNNAGQTLRVLQNTAYGNGDVGFRFREGVHLLRNNLAAENRTEVELDGTDDLYNSWNFDIEEPGFASTSPESPNFLFLSEEAPAIDRGTTLDIEWPTTGSAPDLGAYEESAEQRVGSRLFAECCSGDNG